MKVTAEMANSFGPQDAVTAEVQARYLFGGSAKGSPIDGEWSLSPSAFKPKENADYRFGPQLSDEDKQSGRLVGRVQSKVGDGPLKAPSDLGVKGPSDLSLKVAVLEAGSGRKTKGSAKALIHPADHYVGLKETERNSSLANPAPSRASWSTFKARSWRIETARLTWSCFESTNAMVGCGTPSLVAVAADITVRRFPSRNRRFQ